MARDRAYWEAEQRIEQARQEGAIELDLSNMELTELPEAITSLTQLQTLNLSRNQLTALPEAIASLTQLQQLNLSLNQLTVMPETIASLTELRLLDLTHNELTSLPECLNPLTQMQELYVSRNRLTSLPKSLVHLTQLQTLGLAGNQLASLPELLVYLTQLQTLGLSGNLLESLPIWLCKLTQLHTLGLASNNLVQLPESIGSLVELRHLYLGSQEKDIGRWGFGFGHSHNKLSLLPHSICQLTQLRTLSLEYNSITDLPVALAKLEHLKELDLSDNPLNPDLAAAYEQGTKAVLQYLGAKAEEQVTLNEAKLILIGEGEVGKSCLLGALRGDEWVDGRLTTHGIEIKSVIVTDPNSGTEISLNGWDFGGQRVYRPTHQLFFSAPAVYLVIWKPREGPQQGFVKEWITLIKNREPDAKVIGGCNARRPRTATTRH